MADSELHDEPSLLFRERTISLDASVQIAENLRKYSSFINRHFFSRQLHSFLDESGFPIFKLFISKEGLPQEALNGLLKEDSQSYYQTEPLEKYNEIPSVGIITDRNLFVPSSLFEPLISARLESLISPANHLAAEMKFGVKEKGNDNRNIAYLSGDLDYFTLELEGKSYAFTPRPDKKYSIDKLELIF